MVVGRVECELERGGGLVTVLFSLSASRINTTRPTFTYLGKETKPG